MVMTGQVALLPWATWWFGCPDVGQSMVVPHLCSAEHHPHSGLGVVTHASQEV